MTGPDPTRPVRFDLTREKPCRNCVGAVQQIILMAVRIAKAETKITLLAELSINQFNRSNSKLTYLQLQTE